MLNPSGKMMWKSPDSLVFAILVIVALENTWVKIYSCKFSNSRPLDDDVVCVIVVVRNYSVNSDTRVLSVSYKIFHSSIRELNYYSMNYVRLVFSCSSLVVNVCLSFSKDYVISWIRYSDYCVNNFWSSFFSMDIFSAYDVFCSSSYCYNN